MPQQNTGNDVTWKPTACILCSVNCGLQVQTEGRRITKIKGDKQSPHSRGYTCEKPSRLDHYQNHEDRLTGPLRRRPDGTFEAIDWDTAIREVCQRLVEIRERHGGDKIMYYGGGGQGNHLGGAYSGATRRAFGMRYASNALAQEKTGEFWVERQMLGGRPEGDFDTAEVSVFVGKNPWHSHGFQRARVILKEIARDPNRSMIVLDPRRTETAELADFHLQVRPGTDAFALAAMLGTLVQEDLIDHDFIGKQTVGGDDVIETLREVPITDYCRRADVSESLVRAATRRLAAANSVSVVEDLGIEMAPHSTLNSWLQKLLFVLTGNFGKPGAMNLGTHFGRITSSQPDNKKSPVGQHKIITGLIPCNAIPDEILTDHPDRFRGMLIESGNPVHSLADSPRMREALDAMELVVVIDVAMTETAKHADYVLAAASQYEKCETTFFGGGFPDHVFQLRHPILEPLEGTLTEPEIHSRLVQQLGTIGESDLAPLREAAQEGRAAFRKAFAQSRENNRKLAAVAPVVLYETLGRTLGPGLQGAAMLWGAAHSCAIENTDSVRRAGIEGEGPELGEALFDAILAHPEGVVISADRHEDSYQHVKTQDKRFHLLIPELHEELQQLVDETPVVDDRFPFVLAAGERRSDTANTIYRNPAWRRKDPAGSLRMSPGDAERLGVVSGGRVRITTKRASAEAVVEVNDTMRDGHVSLPNGTGLEYPDEGGRRIVHGTPPNELTSGEDRDWVAGTPWHKHVRARIEAVE